MKCNCGGTFRKVVGKTEEGIVYEAFRCSKCGEEILNMAQAEKLARALERIYSTTVAKWGKAIAIRVPAKVARQQRLKIGQKAHVIPDAHGRGFKVIPA